MSRMSVKTGYTLIEVIVVLVLLTIAAAVVAPSLLAPATDGAGPLVKVVATAREAAVRRGELLRLHVGRSGIWQVTPASGGETLMTGRLPSMGDGTVDLLFSPLGSCGVPPEATLKTGGEIDPLTCEVRTR
jgi:prepilin-type N-terminal cleavage/methylation domain-containing protein